MKTFTYTITATFTDDGDGPDPWDQWAEWLTHPANVENGTLVVTEDD